MSSEALSKLNFSSQWHRTRLAFIAIHGTVSEEMWA